MLEAADPAADIAADAPDLPPQRLGNLLRSCAAQLLKAGYRRSLPVRAFWVPGRVEVLGKHTDYAGGRSLLMAAQRGLALLATPRRDAVLEAMVSGAGRVRIELGGGLRPAAANWTRYAMTVARRLARNFPQPPPKGLAVAVASDLPPASGMSSSSAMIVGFYRVLADRNRLDERDDFRRDIPDDLALAEYLSCVENGRSFGRLAGDAGVGTAGGSEDHVAILCCQAGMLSQYSFAPVRFEDRLRPPEGLTFAVAVSGVAAAKTGAAMRSYNRAAAVARVAVEAWNQATGRRDPHLGAAMAGGPGAASALRDVLRRARHCEFAPGELAGRAEQFEAECRLVPQAVEALRGGHYARLGELVDISQGLARRWLGNQAPQTIALAAQARELGALAASAFGAGFGGSVWALVESSTAGRFLQSWRRRYAAIFPAEARRAEFFTTLPAGPARRF